jgi:hypothetical protein
MATATAAASFHSAWRIGRNVQEIAAPHRKGRIKSVAGTGVNAEVLVTFSGHPPVTFKPAQLRLL